MMTDVPFFRLWRELFYRLGYKRRTRCLVELDEELVQALRAVAQEDSVSEEQAAAELISTSLAHRSEAVYNLRSWRKLSEREKQVAALVCLNYTNRQVAGMLHLSQETIKSHVQNVLNKFGLRSKEDLRVQLSQWDFSAWDVDQEINT